MLRSDDASTVVNRYLTCDEVVRNSNEQDPFSSSRRVFIDRKQTPLQGDSGTPVVMNHERLRMAFEVLCTLYRITKEDREQEIERYFIHQQFKMCLRV